jgi:hypothetical protein
MHRSGFQGKTPVFKCRNAIERFLEAHGFEQKLTHIFLPP